MFIPQKSPESAERNLHETAHDLRNPRVAVLKQLFSIKMGWTTVSDVEESALIMSHRRPHLHEMSPTVPEQANLDALYVWEPF